ncbi:MAG: general stress protein [Pyrinomonadaceae bacterium]
MSDNKNLAVAVFDNHAQAEEAIDELKKANFDIKRLSIIGRDYHTEEHVVGFYNTGDRMKRWGKAGAFWGGLWGLFIGAAFFWIPGIGPILVAGPFVSMLVGALEGAVVVGGLSALGAGLYSIGIPKDSVLEYETQLKAGRYMLIAHGTEEQINQAREILTRTSATQVNVHAEQQKAASPGDGGLS